MYEELKIDPLNHEYTLSKVVSYIDSRLQLIERSKRVDIFDEFANLINYAEKVGLKGNHLPVLRSKMFKFLGGKADDSIESDDKQILIDELNHHKTIMENDIIESKFKDEEDDSINIYILEAHFPLKGKEDRIGVIAHTYSQAAFKIREEYGEFHLQNPNEFRKLECKHLRIRVDEDKTVVICELLRGECPVFYQGDNLCIKPGYENFESHFEKTLEKILNDSS
ncbi:MAG: hypothetical protein AABX55_01670 [Nanoarchaeota archaeon]